MSTKTNKTANKANVVTEINLTEIQKKLEGRTFETKKERSSIYIYPENLKTEKERNSKEGKKFRSKLRRTLERHCTNILLFTAYARMEDLRSEIPAFQKFYKDNYVINDFTVNSVSQSNKEERANDLKMMFEIIAKFETPKKETTKKEKAVVNK